MKKIIFSVCILTLFNCTKKENKVSNEISEEAKKIESINVVRKQMNDSIAWRNQQNVFKDLSGKHQLKFTSDEASPFSGTVIFENTGRDLYNVSGQAKSGKNHVEILGTVKKVSEKHLNFEGEITQNISGNVFKRKKKTTFYDEGKGNFWRLQDKINGSGFVDYIDIYF